MKNIQLVGGRYRMIRTAGKGTQGSAHLAEDTHNDNSLVALKAFPASSQGTKSEIFERECAILRGLRHPNIVRLLDYGREGGTLFYTSEWVDGSDLVTESKKRDWNEIFHLIIQSCWAVDYLHQNRILHRDLKPANILVGRSHRQDGSSGDRNLMVKLIDFGLAEIMDGMERHSEPGGTLAYMAPEVLSGRQPDHRSDLYSLGIVLFEVAWGKLPHHPEESFSDYLKKLLEGYLDLKPLEQWEIPRGIVEAIRGLVVPEPSRRPESAREVIAWINRIEDEDYPFQVPSNFLEDPRWRILEEAAPRGRVNVFSHAGPLPNNWLANLTGLSRSGQKEQGLHFVETHLSAILKTGSRAALVEFYPLWIHLLIEAGRIREAELRLEELGRRVDLGDAARLEYGLLHAYLCHRRGEIAQARQHLTRIEALVSNRMPPDKLGRLKNYWGIIYQAEKNFSEAEKSYDEGLRLATRSKRKDLRLGILTNAAALHFSQNRWDRAFEMFLEAKDLARKIGHRYFLALALNNLGNLFLFFGRWREAEASLMESWEISRDQGLRPLATYNLYLLSVAEEGRADWEKARAYLDKAIDCSREWGNSEIYLQSLLALAYLQRATGSAPQAEKTAGEIKARAEQSDHAHYILQAEWFLAKLRIERGDILDPGLDAVLERVQEEAESLSLANNLWQVLEDRGELEKSRGNTAGAREYYRRSLEVLEALKGRVPEKYRGSFYRDKKKLRILEAMSIMDNLNSEKTSDKVARGAPVEQPQPSCPIPFQQWMQLNRRILQQYRVERLLEELLEASIALTGAERGFVILSDEGKLEIRAAKNLRPESLFHEDMQYSATVASAVLHSGEPRIVLDAQTDEAFSHTKSVQTLKLRSLLCVPLKIGSRTCGLIYLENRLRQGVFRAEDLPLMESFADQASLAIEHARLHQENRKAIQDLEKSKSVIERLIERLEKDLEDKTIQLEAVQEGMRRQCGEIALRFSHDKILGESPKIKEVLKNLERVMDSSINIFIYGESGTGKELIAQAIHYNSPRKNMPFISENCSAIPEALLESELFGHVKGAFTGADKNKIGLFQVANGGTLFLDEVGDMSPALQSKLLRVLQEQLVRPVGSNNYQKVDVRVLSASNKDLLELVRQKKFRQDLYFRLNVMRINLPPLRERREDIPILVDHFVAQLAGGRRIKVPSETMKILMSYDWPGNVRELQNEISRLCAMISGKEIHPSLISHHILEKAGLGSGKLFEKGLDSEVIKLEKKAILQTLSLARGNKVKAAEMLRISRRTLYLKMGQFGIPAKFGKLKATSTKNK